MTDELPVGRTFKRLSMIDTLFGNADYHLACCAAMCGAATAVSARSEYR